MPPEAPLLELDRLQTWFPIRRGLFSRVTGHVRAVDGVSLRVQPGETLGLVGESGCGKTTLARTVMLLEQPTGGRLRFRGADLPTLAPAALRAMRRHLQMIFQDPMAALNPRLTTLDIVAEGLLEHGLATRHDKADQVIRILAEVGLGADTLHRYPHEFSGGQRQRICLARALALKPDLVLCDEAVSALDVSVRAQVLNLFADLRAKHRLAYLFISHDLSVVRHLADRIAVMYLGRIVEQGPAVDLIAQPRHPYTRALISAIPRTDGQGRTRIILAGDVPSPARPPAGCRFHPRCPHAVAICREQDPALEDCPQAGVGRQVACLRKDEL